MRNVILKVTLAILFASLITACSDSGNMSGITSSDEFYESYEGIDTASREYTTGRTIGENFSSVSYAGLTADEVCTAAREDGFRGCLDGFDGVPME